MWSLLLGCALLLHRVDIWNGAAVVVAKAATPACLLRQGGCLQKCPVWVFPSVSYSAKWSQQTKASGQLRLRSCAEHGFLRRFRSAPSVVAFFRTVFRPPFWTTPRVQRLSLDLFCGPPFGPVSGPLRGPLFGTTSSCGLCPFLLVPLPGPGRQWGWTHVHAAGVTAGRCMLSWVSRAGHWVGMLM